MVRENLAFLGDLAQFEQRILQIAELAHIDLSRLEIDHLAVRVNHLSSALQWRENLLKQAELLKESEVNGRPIALFELKQAVKFCEKSVKIIELPFPKDKIYPSQGWEHIEAVVPFLPQESVEQWTARVLAHYQLTENSALNLKVSQPSVKGERLANPTIAITVKNATLCNHSCLKLHPYGINDIIRSEI